MDTPTAAARALAWQRWLRTWTALSAPGALLALVYWGLAPSIWAAAAITVVLLVGHAGHHATEPRASLAARSRSAQTLVLFGVAFGLGWSVLVDLSVLGGLAVAALAAASSPPLLAWWRDLQAAPGQAPPSPSSTLTALLADPAQRMTDAQLCKAWRESFDTLQAARTARERTMIVALRQSFMDTFGARHPLAFQAWLASNPHASGGPDRFLKKRA